MHPYTFVYISAYSLAPAVIAGLLHYYMADKKFRPFIYLMWLGLGNEIFSTIIIKITGSNAINNNVYVLLEALLVLWQFYKWEVLKRTPLFVLLAVAVVGWLFENVWLGEIRSFDNLFRMYGCALFMLLAIWKLTRLPKELNGKHYRNACLFICMGLVLYNSINLYMEFLFHAFGTATWKGDLFWWGGWANIIANCLFFIAILWIPRKSFPFAT